MNFNLIMPVWNGLESKEEGWNKMTWLKLRGDVVWCWCKVQLDLWNNLVTTDRV